MFLYYLCIKIHFLNHCKVVEKMFYVVFFWSVYNYFQFMNSISNMKMLHNIKTFAFSTLCTNLPLNVIHDSLRSVMIKMFTNSHSNSNMVNPIREKSIPIKWLKLLWSRGIYHWQIAWSLRIDCFKYLFNKNKKFKHILGIPMGGNSSPFIADLDLPWCGFCYVIKIPKNNCTLAKQLSYNCRYLDDICTVNVNGFGDVAKISMIIPWYFKGVITVTSKRPSWHFIYRPLSRSFLLAYTIK